MTLQGETLNPAEKLTQRDLPRTVIARLRQIIKETPTESSRGDNVPHERDDPNPGEQEFTDIVEKVENEDGTTTWLVHGHFIESSSQEQNKNGVLYDVWKGWDNVHSFTVTKDGKKIEREGLPHNGENIRVFYEKKRGLFNRKVRVG